jgi:hypothetical protein
MKPPMMILETPSCFSLASSAPPAKALGTTFSTTGSSATGATSGAMAKNAESGPNRPSPIYQGSVIKTHRDGFASKERT